jgi:hypothetical protein
MHLAPSDDLAIDRWRACACAPLLALESVLLCRAGHEQREIARGSSRKWRRGRAEAAAVLGCLRDGWLPMA